MAKPKKAQIMCYTNRNDPKYFGKLSEILNMEVLKKIAVDNPDKTDEKYKRVIRIDFCGIAGTTLLLQNGDAQQKKIQQQFLDIFERLDELRDQGIKLRTRFLFMYLYSDFSYTQIEAEKSPNRPTIAQKRLEESELNLFSLTTENFNGSNVANNQREALLEIQRIYNKYCIHNSNTNILNLRFTCLPINYCTLGINGHYFIDPYSYAKESRYSKLSYKTPVIDLNPSFEDSIAIVEDHFRYMWTHPTTLMYEDATNYQFDGKKRLESLESIKSPQEISFEYKTNKFKKNYAKQLGEDKINKWKFRVERMFRNMTRVIDVVPEAETVFIAFSFLNGKQMCDSIKEF